MIRPSTQRASVRFHLSGLTLVSALLLSVGLPLTVEAQNPQPGMVMVEGKPTPFITWLDSVWTDHLTARAATALESPLLMEAFFRDALRVAPNSPVIVEQLTIFYQRNNMTPMNHAFALLGRKLEPDKPYWNEILKSMPARESLLVSGKDGLDYEVPLSKKDDKEYRLFKEKIAAGDIMSGELILRGLISAHPGDLRFLVDLGILYAQHSDWGMAAAIFSYAHELYPAHFATTFNLSMTLGKIGMHEQALLILQEQLKQNPKDPNLLRATSIQAISMGRNDEAFDLAKRWITADPNDPEAHNSLALVLIDTRRFADADVRLATSLKLEPHRTDTILLKTQAEIRLGRFEEARKRLVRLAADVDPAEIKQLITRDPYNLIPDIEKHLSEAAKTRANP